MGSSFNTVKLRGMGTLTLAISRGQSQHFTYIFVNLTVLVYHYLLLRILLDTCFKYFLPLNIFVMKLKNIV